MSFELLVLIVSPLLVTALIAGMRAAPYLPTFQRDIDRVLRLAEIQSGDLVIDLGAGDGRLIKSAIQRHDCRAVGYEISILPFLIAWVRLVFGARRGVGQIRFADFFRINLSQANVIFCFLTPRAMKKLEPKFLQELQPGTRVISYAFRLPTLEPATIDQPQPTAVPIFFYRIPAA